MFISAPDEIALPTQPGLHKASRVAASEDSRSQPPSWSWPAPREAAMSVPVTRSDNRDVTSQANPADAPVPRPDLRISAALATAPSSNARHPPVRPGLPGVADSGSFTEVPGVEEVRMQALQRRAQAL